MTAAAGRPGHVRAGYQCLDRHLHYQTLTTLAAALQRIGRAAAAQPFTEQAQRIREDFQRLLVVDGTLTGYAYFHEDGRIVYGLHPGDQATGIRFSLLPMIHAIINGLLTVEQARTHVGHIKGHLLAVDGARVRSSFDCTAATALLPARQAARTSAGDRHHVYARPLAVRRGHGTLRRCRRLVSGVAPGKPVRRAGGRVPGAAAAGELLLLQLGRTVRGSVRGPGGVRESAHR
jgi:hypothetical protein